MQSKLSRCVGDGRVGDPRSKAQGQLRPILRSQPGYVYSKKMTLGCNLRASSGKRRAKKKGTIASVGSNGGASAVRSLLPWWQHTASTIGSDVKKGGSPYAKLRQEDEGGHDGVAAVTELSSSPQPTGRATLKSPVDDTEYSTSGRTALNPRAIDTAAYSTLNEKGRQQETEEYTHYANLFENPPPSIPEVDQYVFNDNVMYEALTKRGHSKALPLSPSGAGMLGMEGCGNASWSITADREELQAYVDPSTLLYADEDIDKVRTSSRW